jgi:hypothetical protein
MTTTNERTNMQAKLLHAILSGTIIALMLGFFLIPATWQMIIRQHEEPTFGPAADNTAVMETILSVAVIAITLLSFKLVRSAEE